MGCSGCGQKYPGHLRVSGVKRAVSPRRKFVRNGLAERLRRATENKEVSQEVVVPVTKPEGESTS